MSEIRRGAGPPIPNVPNLIHHAACGQVGTRSTGEFKSLGSCILTSRSDGLWAATANHVVGNIPRESLVVMPSMPEWTGNPTSPIRPPFERRVLPGTAAKDIERDLVIFKFNFPRIDVLEPELDIDSAISGQEVFLMGYPKVKFPNSDTYIHNDTAFNPVLKSGPMSGIFFDPEDELRTRYVLIGVQSNKGYSGGPVCVSGHPSGKDYVIGMTVEMTADEKERQIYGNSGLTPVKEDAGFTWALSIDHVIDLLDQHSVNHIDPDTGNFIPDPEMVAEATWLEQEIEKAGYSLSPYKLVEGE